VTVPDITDVHPVEQHFRAGRRQPGLAISQTPYHQVSE